MRCVIKQQASDIKSDTFNHSAHHNHVFMTVSLVLQMQMILMEQKEQHVSHGQMISKNKKNKVAAGN